MPQVFCDSWMICFQFSWSMFVLVWIFIACILGGSCHWKLNARGRQFSFRSELLLTWGEMNASYCLVAPSMHRTEGEASPTPTRTVCVCCCGERCTKRDGPAVRLWISPPCSQVPHADTGTDANSKHWFTTSFLQPLPYLGSIGSRKLSANEQFFCWCSNSSKFVTNNSDYIRRLFYNWPCCLRQLK